MVSLLSSQQRVPEINTNLRLGLSQTATSFIILLIDMLVASVGPSPLISPAPAQCCLLDPLSYNILYGSGVQNTQSWPTGPVAAIYSAPSPFQSPNKSLTTSGYVTLI